MLLLLKAPAVRQHCTSTLPCHSSTLFTSSVIHKYTIECELAIDVPSGASLFISALLKRHLLRHVLGICVGLVIMIRGLQLGDGHCDSSAHEALACFLLLKSGQRHG
jgi:hypothetical protein